MKKTTSTALIVIIALIGGLGSAIVQLDKENKERMKDYK